MNRQVTELSNLPAVGSFDCGLAEAWPPENWKNHRVLIAVSGGADSVALLRSMLRVAEGENGGSEKLAVAHVNHGLRGHESDGDQEFVQRLGESLGIRVFSRRIVPDLTRSHAPDGLESAARQVRYDVLTDIAHDFGARYLVAAHTQDDQVETLLFRIFRGTGIAGLSGIPASRVIDESLSLVRPLLAFRRTLIEEYLAGLGQEFRTDRSNDDPDFATRNWIRHELLPLVQSKFGGRADASITQLAHVAQQYHELVASLAQPLLDRAIVAVRPEGVVLRRTVFDGQSPVVVQAALQRLWERQGWPQQDMGFEQWQRLTRYAMETPTRANHSDFPGGVSAVLQAGELHLTRRARQ